jgi:hypothetical protein
MDFWVGIVVGLFIGSTLGILAAALLRAAKGNAFEDEWRRRHPYG